MSFLATLAGLAEPLTRRRERQRCFAGLKLLKEGINDWGHWMVFRLPPDADAVDINSSDPMLILSDGHPDRVLDPQLWPAMRVRLAPRSARYPDTLLVSVAPSVYSGEAFAELRARLGDAGWVLERAHFNSTSRSLQEFLAHLDGGVT